MPQHLPGDDHDDLAAMDFSVADDDRGEKSAADMLGKYVPAQPENTGTAMDAMRSQTQATGEEEEKEDEDAVELFTVTNPPRTVRVSALMDGRIQQIDLSAKLTSISESDLADEILVLADLARQKGLAGLHTYLLESESELGLDGTGALPDFVKTAGLDLPTAEQVAAAQAEVFATRYPTDK